MIIRCPYCEFSRSLNEQSIPSGAEFVTCPKCKHRFKFRSVEKAEEFSLEPHPPIPPIKRDESHTDIWDAVDALHQKFEQKMGEHDTDVNVQNTAPLSKQEQKEQGKTFENSQQRVKEELHSEHAITSKKIDKTSQKQRKKTSGFSGLLSSLPLFASTANSAKEKVSDSKKAEQEEVEQNKQIRQQIQTTEPSTPSHLENEESVLQDIKKRTSTESLLPEEIIYSQESNKEPISLLTTRKAILKESEEIAIKVNTSSQNYEGSAEAEHGVIDPSEKKTSLYSEPSIHVSASPVSADIKKEVPVLASASEEEIKKTEQSTIIETETSSFSAKELESSFMESNNYEQPKQTEKTARLKESDTFRPLFPHCNDDIPLEQRLQLPPTPSNRPQRDLGRLDDIKINENVEPTYGAPIGNTLWESPLSHGWGKSFLHTVRSVMFSAPSFFLKVSGNSGISLAFLFFLIQGYLTILCSIFWAYTAKDVLDIPLLTIALTNLPFLLLLAPLALGLILIFSAGVMRLLLDVCGVHNVPFPLVARIVCYSTAPMVLSIIPFIGPPIGALWFFIAMVIAGKQIFSLSWFSSVLFTLPATFSIVTGILVFFL